MPAAVIVLLIAAAIIVAALALYLTRIALLLKHVNFTLGTIIVGIKAIAAQCEPINPLIDEINKDLSDVREALENLLAKKAAQAAPPRVGGRRSR